MSPRRVDQCAFSIEIKIPSLTVGKRKTLILWDLALVFELKKCGYKLLLFDGFLIKPTHGSICCLPPKYGSELNYTCDRHLPAVTDIIEYD